MSSYLPSLKWPTALSFATRTSSPAEDAPLDALPEAEAAALSRLQELFDAHLAASAPPLPPAGDPWGAAVADARARDEILLRFLRYNALHVDRAARQLRAVLAWRAKSRIYAQPRDVMRGMAAGIPVSVLDAVGGRGQRLFFAAAERYVKRDVDHSVQEVAVAKMFEHMLYDVDGPRVKGVDVVVDFTGFSAKNIDLYGLKTGVSTYLNYYPEILHKVLLINYPKFLYGVWRVIRPLLDERTANRVIWLSDGAALRSELEGSFAKPDIPHFLGGGLQLDDKFQLLNGQTVDPDELASRFS